MRTARFISLVLVSSLMAAARADDLLLLDSTGRVLRLETDDGTLDVPQALVGKSVEAGITAIVAHPGTHVVYGLALDRLFTIDPTTGWTSPFGTPFRDVSLQQTGTSLDIDTAANELRALVLPPANGLHDSDSRLLRFDADTGELIGSHYANLPTLTYFDGVPERLPGGASIAHAPDGTVYGLDRWLHRLFRFGSPPEDGVLTTVGPLTGLFNTGGKINLEIVGDGTAYLLEHEEGVPDVPSGRRIGVYRIDLATGAASLVSGPDLGPGIGVIDMTTAPLPRLQTIRALDVQRAVLRLSFRRSPVDSFEIRGTLPEASDGWEGKSVRVCVRSFPDSPSLQFNREFVLDRRGRSRTRSDSFSVATRAKEGGVPFVLKMKHTRLPHFLIEPQRTRTALLEPTVDALVDGHAFRARFDMAYAGGRRGGVARKLP